MTGFINIDATAHLTLRVRAFDFWFSDEDGVGNMVIALMTPR